MPAVATALFGIFSYRNQKNIDRQVELRKEQKAAYELYMQSYHDWTFTEDGTAEDAEANDKYWRAYFKLFPIASDGFLRAAMAFHTYAKVEPYPDFKKDADRKKFKELWTNLVVEMRNDANVESRLTKREIEDHSPWYWSSYESMPDGNVDTSATTSSQELDE